MNQNSVLLPFRRSPVPPLTLALILTLNSCGDGSSAQTQESIRAVADEVIPRVEQAVGLEFKSPPELALRSREQVRDYLNAKIQVELPPEEIERLTIAYRMFGLIPDTLDLAALLLELYAEQVAGFYDPDSSVLYVVEGSDPTIAELTIAHELVHALQHQYMPLDSVLTLQRQNDRRIAAQSILEGQAMLASVLAMMPGQDLSELGTFWNDAQRRELIREQEQRMPVFASAPLILREGLIFPYLAGADFMGWFERVYPDTVPYGPRLPTSTEHILHPDRYAAGDTPVDLMFPNADDAVYVDGLGEFEIRILLTELTGSTTVASAGSLGWDGDRYAVYSVGDEHGLVWWSVWDGEAPANRFARLLEAEWSNRPVGGRYLVRREAVSGYPAVLFMLGPEMWDQWDAPAVVVEVR
jgi:hypothetical protein